MRLLDRLLQLVPRLWGNWISLLGTTLATLSGNAILIVTVVDIVSGGSNQYLAAFGYLLMPPLFVLGLALIGLGVWRGTRRGEGPGSQTTLDRAVSLVLGDRAARRRVAFVVAATLLNVTLISVAAYQGITYMDTTRFCGQLCHSVMEPEASAYSRSPHARVPCVDCHIGEGASWFVRSKLSGMRQIWATLLGDFSRPIPTPVAHLRPARETCEHCHWPEQFHGSRTLVRHVYQSDRASTRTTNVVRLNVGGVNKRTGRYEGIHWHVAPDVRIEYESSDPGRRAIGRVVLTRGGQSTVFLPPADRRGATSVERRVMDCVDCHNRPTHIFDPSPEAAVDRALALGKLDLTLPFIRRRAVALLRRRIDPPQEASRVLAGALRAAYKKSHPELAARSSRALEKAGRELSWIYRRNIYPRLKITWGTYPSHLGHRRTTEGCFRCHDDEHRARGKGSRVISQDCDLCHEVLAQEEEKPDLPEGIMRLGNL